MGGRARATRSSSSPGSIPTRSSRRSSFDDYMFEGPLAALDAMEQATGESEANVIGYCLGGTLLAVDPRLHDRQRRQPRRQRDLFRHHGRFRRSRRALGLHRRGAARRARRAHEEHGYLEGSRHGDDLQHAARERPDLVVRRQQLPARQRPLPVRSALLELDSTRMPAAMHSFYLRNMYQENKLVVPGGSPSTACRSICARSRRRASSCRPSEDHIAPWKSTYAATQIYGGPVKFVLSASGHIAGVVNPPGKRNTAIGPTPSCRRARTNGSPAAKCAEGSWWPSWEKWIAQICRRRGRCAPARRRQAQADRGRARLLRADKGRLAHGAAKLTPRLLRATLP